MAIQTEDKVYSHYDHTDACKFSRWTARESYEFMYGRQWQQVHDFYLSAVNGQVSLSEFLGTKITLSTDSLIQGDAEIVGASERSQSLCEPDEKRTGRWERATYKIVLSYHGESFDGWQKQPGLNTVQGHLEKGCQSSRC